VQPKQLLGVAHPLSAPHRLVQQFLSSFFGRAFAVLALISLHVFQFIREFRPLRVLTLSDVSTSSSLLPTSLPLAAAQKHKNRKHSQFSFSFDIINIEI